MYWILGLTLMPLMTTKPQHISCRLLGPINSFGQISCSFSKLYSSSSTLKHHPKLAKMNKYFDILAEGKMDILFSPSNILRSSCSLFSSDSDYWRGASPVSWPMLLIDSLIQWHFQILALSKNSNTVNLYQLCKKYNKYVQPHTTHKTCATASAKLSFESLSISFLKFSAWMCQKCSWF